MAEYEGKKLQEIHELPPEVDIRNSKVLVVTEDNQYLVPMATLVNRIKELIQAG